MLDGMFPDEDGFETNNNPVAYTSAFKCILIFSP